MQFCSPANQKGSPHEKINVMVAIKDSNKGAEKEMLGTQMEKNIAEPQKGIEDQEQKEVRLRKM